ncbi:restriction endonuclease subunit S [Neobacillus drentensis]|uniref:restriction endonuclease subunit S n=1 Tax=Neobacillus drentensis TaxID=220684 RepID=UPI0030019285
MSKKEKTIEELLEEALVPEDEQPNEIPENWAWVKSEFVAKWGSGGTPSRKKSEYYNGNIPWLKTGELRDNIIFDSEEKITEEGLKQSSAKLFPKDSVAIAMYGATIGRLGILGIDAATNQACAVGVPYSFMDKKFMFYYFLSQRQKLIDMGKGGAQPNISQTIIKEFPHALPPLNEQKRIAEKVGRLLSKVEDAKQLIAEAIETFEIRRAAILDKAFRGELTTKWRESNSTVESFDELLEKIISEKERIYLGLLQKANVEGIKKPARPKKFNNKINQESAIALPRNWGYCTLGDVIYDFKYGTSEKSDYDYKGTPVIRIPNIGEEFINVDDLKYLKENSRDSNVSVLEGDILIVRSNGSRDLVGKCSIVQKSEEMFAFASYLIRLRPVVVVPEFILWLLKSDRVKEQFFSKSKSSAGINNINTEELATTIIPLPPIEEQREIVRKLKALLAKEEKTKKMLDMDKQVETLKQSILSKAFCGELGTNDTSEESAFELLKEVLLEQVK